MRSLLAVLSLLVVLCISTSAVADIATLGDAYEVGSWAQRFDESGVGPYDHMQFLWVAPLPTVPAPSGPGFEKIVNFSQPALWNTYVSSDASKVIASTKSGTVTAQQFDLWFLSPAGTKPAAQFQFQAFNGTRCVENVLAKWNGSWQFIAQSTQGQTRQTAVPEPISMVLGSLGLVSVAGFRRLRKS